MACDMVPVFLARTVEGLAAYEDSLLKRDGFFQRQALLDPFTHRRPSAPCPQ